LDEIILKSTPPITVKKDTLEFNASSFKTRKNATIEELLKKLPGVEVFDDGSIKVNGKEVNKILINGKPFFSDDPTIATRSLSKDFIDKVQVSNTKSKEEAFAGEKGSSTKSTINFTIKKDLGKGVFGRIGGGLGTDERFEVAGIANYFDDDSQLSALGSGNNINSPGFSFGEIQKMFGKGDNSSKGNNESFEIDGRQFGGDIGIVTSSNTGINYANDIGNTADYSANYFYNNAGTFFKQISSQENILPEFNYFSNSQYEQNSDFENHWVKFNSEIVIDSTFLITLKPNFGLSNGRETTMENQESRNTENNTVNETQSESDIESSNRSFSNLLTITKRIGQKGSFLKVKGSNKLNTTNSQEFFKSDRTIFGSNASVFNRNIFLENERTKRDFNIGVTYRLPINGYTFFVDLKQNITTQNESLEQNTFDFNTQTQNYSLFNEDISADVEYKKTKYLPGLSFSYQKEKWSVTLGMDYAQIKLNNDDVGRPNFEVARNFKAFDFNGFFSYISKPGSLLNLSYSLKNKAPDFRFLQSFQNISNPLNTVIGNPNLELSKTHQIFGIYNVINFEKGNGVQAVVSGVFIEDLVTPTITINEDLTRETSYVNANGFYNVSLELGYNVKNKLNANTTLIYRFGLDSRVNNIININNGIQYDGQTISFTPKTSATIKWKNILEISPSYRFSFSTANFDTPTLRNQQFIQHNARIKTALFALNDFEWRNDINYLYNPNVASGFQKSTFLWNTTLDYSFLENKATVSLKVYDLLNQNTDVSRRSNANFIEDSQTTVLQRYFMFGLSWRFDTLNKT
jgi:hypothetical protein